MTPANLNSCWNRHTGKMWYVSQASSEWNLTVTDVVQIMALVSESEALWPSFNHSQSWFGSSFIASSTSSWSPSFVHTPTPQHPTIAVFLGSLLCLCRIHQFPSSTQLILTQASAWVSLPQNQTPFYQPLGMLVEHKGSPLHSSSYLLSGCWPVSAPSP